MIKKKVDFIKFMVMIISNFIIKFHIYKNIIFSLYYNSTRNIIQEINNCELSIISDLKYINNLLNNLKNLKIIYYMHASSFDWIYYNYSSLFHKVISLLILTFHFEFKE